MALGTAAPSEAARPKKNSRPAKTARVAWTGLVPGPLSPKDARALEHELLEALREDQRTAILDVGGRPIGATAEQRLGVEIQARYDEAIQALLREDHALALRELELVNEQFERGLAGSRDHGIRHGTLIAKATLYVDTGRKEAARLVLRELAALDPGPAAPTRENQSEALVTLYEEVLRELDRSSMLRFEGETKDTRLRLDGRDLGEAPFAPVRLAPGRHLLSIRTPALHRVEILTLGPGEERLVRLPGEGPEERLRNRFLEDVAFRPTQLADSARKISKLAGADHLMVAWIRKEADATRLYLGLLDPSGRAEKVGRTELAGESPPGLRALMKAALDPKRRGGFEVSTRGELASSEELLQALGERKAR